MVGPVDKVIFEAIAGSQAYGTNTPESDTDIRGIFITPLEKRLSLFGYADEVSDEKQDVKYYDLAKFMHLASQCNPNIIELLWTPEDCIRILKPEMQILLDHRHLFISKNAYNTFTGYAYAQIKKARGQNKMVYNSQPEVMPTKEDFCWFVNINSQNNKPIPFSEARIDLKQCHAAAMEHMVNTFRLYYYGPMAKGVFRGNDTLTCESIPKDDEVARFIGLLVYNKDAHSLAVKEWHKYWDWMKQRNPKRWEGQESGEKDYDQKNMMHCMRLILSGEHILTMGEPIVRFQGEQLELLRNIRAGKLKYDEIMNEVEQRVLKLKDFKEASKIPDQPKKEAIDRIFKDILVHLPL